MYKERMLQKMNEAIAKFAKKRKLHIQISFETVMACGLGLCQGCAIRCKPASKGDKYALVCKDGPVFRGEELDFED